LLAAAEKSVVTNIFFIVIALLNYRFKKNAKYRFKDIADFQ
jgi:hypothetical protein